MQNGAPGKRSAVNGDIKKEFFARILQAAYGLAVLVLHDHTRTVVSHTAVVLLIVVVVHTGTSLGRRRTTCVVHAVSVIYWDVLSAADLVALVAAHHVLTGCRAGCAVRLRHLLTRGCDDALAVSVVRVSRIRRAVSLVHLNRLPIYILITDVVSTPVIDIAGAAVIVILATVR